MIRIYESENRLHARRLPVVDVCDISYNCSIGKARIDEVIDTAIGCSIIAVSMDLFSLTHSHCDSIRSLSFRLR